MRPACAPQAVETPVSQQTDQSEPVSSIELPDAVLRWEAQMIEAGRESLPFSVHHLAHVLANTKKIQSKTRRRRARGGTAEVGGLQQLGPQVVAAVVREGIIPDFIIEWRTLFMKMTPQHMPAGWTVGAKTTRAFGKHSRFQRQLVPNPQTGELEDILVQMPGSPWSESRAPTPRVVEESRLAAEAEICE